MVERVRVQVKPVLDRVIAAAREAGISIQEMGFVQRTVANPQTSEDLRAVTLYLEGQAHALGYFYYLLEQHELRLSA